MFRRDIFVLVAVALIGIVMTIYMTFGQTPFFPKSLLTTMGDCPGWRGVIPPHRTVVMREDEVGWFRNDLMSFHEEPIFQQKERSERVVRFLLLPSDLPPVMVRTVESPNGRVRLIGKLPPGTRGCGKDGRGCSVDRILTPDEAARLTEAQAPLFQKASFGCHSGVDGSMWIVEASGRGDYRYWQTWSPAEGEVRDLAVSMVDMTGWSIFPGS